MFSMPESDRSIDMYAVRYADADYFADQIVAPSETEDAEFGKGTEFVPFNWLFYVIRVTTQEKVRTILLDTGFTSHGILKAWNMDVLNGKPFVLHDIPALLGTIGMRPEDVTDVMLTHHDFDHVGGQHLFPRAHVHMNRAALDTLLATRDIPEVAEDLERRRGGETLTEFDERYEFEGIRMRMIGGHTPGSCVAELIVGDTTYAFVADECYVLANAEEGKTIGYRIGDKAKNVAFVQEMKARLDAVDPTGAQKGNVVKTGPDGKKIVVLPFHDPAVSQQFPAVEGSEGRVSKIA
jgi:glyoxylase-like metal-dependent hydrolase (beta-lactamase superfamily II)